MTQYGISVPDNELLGADNLEDLEQAFKNKTLKPVIKGKPASELFHGQALPDNLEIINYTKRRWGKKYIL